MTLTSSRSRPTDRRPRSKAWVTRSSRPRIRTAPPSTSRPAHPLAPGTYRLDLVAGASVTDASDALAPIPAGGPLGTFTIHAPGIGLDAAKDLGSLASPVAKAAGTLDISRDPAAVALYKVELPADHFWRLGVEVDAQSIGSSLRTSLAVFDASGRPISTSEIGQPSAPADPYVFLGLPGGTYYLGVSGAGKRRGTTGRVPPRRHGRRHRRSGGLLGIVPAQGGRRRRGRPDRLANLSRRLRRPVLGDSDRSDAPIPRPDRRRRVIQQPDRRDRSGRRDGPGLAGRRVGQ